MKTFNRWVNSFPKTIRSSLTAIYRGNLFHPKAMPDFGDKGVTAYMSKDMKTVYHYIPADTTPEQWWMIYQGIANKQDTAFETWVLSGLFGGGIKLFFPTLAECEVLSKIDINIKWPDYRQPFDSIGMMLPDGYQYLTGSPKSGEMDVGPVIGMVGRLDTKEKIWAARTINGTNTEGIPHGLTIYRNWPSNPKINIESSLSSEDIDNPSLTSTETESLLKISKLFINSCLLMTEYGHVCDGYANPEYAERLLQRKKGMSEGQLLANMKALEEIPIIYSFSQHIKLWETDGDHIQDGTSHEGYHVRPHWRRGHWAMVACGKEHSQRRLAFKRPCLVNRQFLAGQESDTSVQITTK